MTQQEYEQKKHECWEHIKFALPAPNTYRKIFDIIFDRAYTLSKQTKTILQEEIEKAWQDYAKEIGLPESLNYASKSMIEIAIKQAFRTGATLNGKQEKDAENTPISERLAPEEKSQLEGIYYYLKRAADKQENESVSVAVLFEVMERLEDIFGIDLLTNGHGKLAPKDADPVIQGWAARDEDGALCIYEYKPKRVYDTWAHENVWIGEILLSNVHTKPFFNLIWEDEPQEVEITIKRKKK